MFKRETFLLFFKSSAGLVSFFSSLPVCVIPVDEPALLPVLERYLLIYSTLLVFLLLFASCSPFFVGDTSGEEPVSFRSRRLTLEFALEVALELELEFGFVSTCEPSFLSMDELEFVKKEFFDVSLDWYD